MLAFVRTHQQIDRRSLALARAVVAKIDGDPSRRGLERAREVCARWARETPSAAVAEWSDLLRQDWKQIRDALLAQDEAGQQRRQNSPFCGVLSPSERWAIYQRFRGEQKAA
ncbi:hypothetical protein HQ590_07425 [bacterium]|nr:hypothetical protein [bacterium]